MKIRIKNKNNNELFDIDEGAVITICKDETLDSGTVSISNLNHEINIEPYDVCEIIGKSTYTMCVNSFVKTQICLSPKLYKYEITLFSLTKQLEGIILPSLKITKIQGITRSIWSYMREYLKEYCPQIKVGTIADFDYYQKWILDDNFSSKFADECPEMQWNQPTLREVLNDLAMLKDCIVIINSDNKISFIDLTEITNPNEIAMSGINYIQESKGSEDYVSDLRMNLVNVTNDKTDGINNYVTRSEFISINSDEGIMTSENVVCKTQYPIYKIKKLEMLFPVIIPMFTAGDIQRVRFGVWVKQDLMDAKLLHAKYLWNPEIIHGQIIAGDNNPSEMGYNHEDVVNCAITEHNRLVYEEKEWQVKYNINSLQAFNMLYDDEFPEFKEFVLYYTRGDRNIRGFNQTYKRLNYTSYTLLTRLKCALTGGLKGTITREYNNKTYKYDAVGSGAVYNKSVQDSQLPVIVTGEFISYATYFYIEYETLENSTFKAGKDIIKDENGDYYPSHQREVIDNQTNSYIDSYSQGFLEYQKANRLGNMQKMINARYMDNESIANMLKIGDVIDESVIYKCEYQFYKQHVEVNALATKDYVLRNYFTGIKAKIRSWNVLSGNEALTRSDLYKYYLEFSFNQKDDNGLAWEEIYDYNLPEYFISSLTSNDVEPLRYCFMYTEDSNGNRYPSDITVDGETAHCYYKIDLVSRIVGNSLVFSFGLKDNVWVDKYIDLTNVTVKKGEYNSSTGVQYNIRYELGEHSTPGGILTQYYRYSDVNAEFRYISWVFTDNYVGRAFNISNGDTTLNDESVSFIEYACVCPKTSERDFRGEITSGNETIDYDHSKTEFYKELHKDSQEITNISTQFELCRDTNDICFTKDFIARQKAIRTISNNISFKLIIANSSTYNFRNIQVPSVSNQINTYTVTTSNVNPTTASTRLIFSIGGHHKNDLLNKALYITDENNVLLMALNNVPSENIVEITRHNTDRTNIHVYLNLLKTRDYNVYDSQLNQNVVDKL